MGKKAKDLIKKNLEKVTDTVSKEVSKAQEQFNAMLNDLLRQAESLQAQVTEPFRKMIKDMEELREKELQRLQSEYQRMLEELQNVQQQFLERLGLARPKADEPAKTSDKVQPAAAEKPAAPAETTKPATQGASRSGKTAAPKASGTRKPAPAKAAPRKKKVDIDDLTQLTGVGPATAKKMNAAGIHSLKQIANPSEDDKAILAQFSNVRHHEKWQAEARALLNG
ncbi:helix-hairpin-helix domain-containing protein [Hahella sp. SMD15-11]|uniref:Helix-hairpin-helix domain-containing protein n=1 Tax=Thermohahella caldifontis TaxID=3142973 RepID=A0AB39V0L1_9GAMM